MKLSSPESGVETEIPDSSLIISTLVEDGVLPDINARLSPVEKARDLGVRALLEDKLYFVQVSSSGTKSTSNDIYTIPGLRTLERQQLLHHAIQCTW